MAIKKRMSLPWWLSGKESACQWRRCGFSPWVGKIPWRRKWQPTPGFVPRESHWQRNLAGYSPWGHKASDMTDRVSKRSKCFWHIFLTVQGWHKIGKEGETGGWYKAREDSPLTLILFRIHQKDEHSSMSYMKVIKTVNPKSFHHTEKIVLFL